LKLKQRKPTLENGFTTEN